MEEFIPIKTVNAIKAINGASPEVKKALRDLFGKDLPPENVMDRIKSYEDACLDQGVTLRTIDQFDFFPEEDREYHFYNHQYDIIHRALVQGWKADRSDSNQAKYFPRFYWNKDRAGGPGLSFIVHDFSLSHSYVGARREFPTWELAQYSGTQFLSIHEKLHTL